ncbi:MAG TPA: DUF3488 and transglutaminase-like domain-containing protein [Candidatus Lumbricidophila sp.]|nr:DUF3488 and transglutaminase-like domain-containing protein [Candidatus Lumbricidophila sp.]
MIKIPPASALSHRYLIALTVAAWVALGVSLLVLRPLLVGTGWWWQCVVASAMVFAASAAVWRWRASVLLTLVAQVVGSLLLLTVMCGGGTGIFALVPTFATFERFWGMASAARQSIVEQAAPIAATESIAFLLIVAAIAVTVLAFHSLIWLRWPPLTAIVLVIPVVVPPLVLPAADSWHLVLVGASLLLLLRLDVLARRHAEGSEVDRPRGIQLPSRRPLRFAATARTVGVAFVAMTLTALVGSALPAIDPVRASGTPAVTLDGTSVSPYLDLARDIRRPTMVTLFTYTSTDGARPYFRMLVIDDFTGRDWKATQSRFEAKNSILQLPPPTGLDASIQPKRQAVEVTIRALNTRWLPTPFPADRVTGLNGLWAYDELSRAIRSTQPDTLGQRYLVEQYVLEPTPTQLRRKSVIERPEIAQFLELPQEAGIDRIADALQQVVGTIQNPYDQAVELQSWFRDGAFLYSETAPAQAGYDGSGTEVLARFLDAKAGYCIHFASAMALMARILGIPSRVAVGYLPGTLTDRTEDGQKLSEVTSHDLHAWPELYFEGVGWLPFEPTPGRGAVPPYTLGELPSPAATPIATSPASAPTVSAAPERPEDAGAPATPGAGASLWSWLLPTLLSLVGALALACLPMLVRVAARARRRRRCLWGEQPASAAWSELVASALDHRIALPSRASPAVTARALIAQAGLVNAGADALALLREATEREWFGRPFAAPGTGERVALWQAVHVVRQRIADRRTPGQRVAEALLPRSLPSQVAAAFTRRQAQ